jgi:L-asparaginase II
MAVDGCSVPTWSMPLAALAQGFARIGTGQHLAPARARAGGRLRRACFAAPAQVAGEGRFDTVVMSGLAPQVFSKGGAEGVQCAALPELGLGIALKIDDGAKRGSERALAEVLAALLPGARRALADQLEGEVRNWRGTSVGRIVAAPALADALAAFTARPRGRARMLGGS